MPRRLRPFSDALGNGMERRRQHGIDRDHRAPAFVVSILSVVMGAVMPATPSMAEASGAAVDAEFRAAISRELDAWGVQPVADDAELTPGRGGRRQTMTLPNRRATTDDLILELFDQLGTKLTYRGLDGLEASATCNPDGSVTGTVALLFGSHNGNGAAGHARVARPGGGLACPGASPKSYATYSRTPMSHIVAADRAGDVSELCHEGDCDSRPHGPFDILSHEVTYGSNGALRVTLRTAEPVNEPGIVGVQLTAWDDVRQNWTVGWSHDGGWFVSGGSNSAGCKVSGGQPTDVTSFVVPDSCLAGNLAYSVEGLVFTGGTTDSGGFSSTTDRSPRNGQAGTLSGRVGPLVRRGVTSTSQVATRENRSPTPPPARDVSHVCDEDMRNPFADVASTNVHSATVACAYQHGLTKGTGQATYTPKGHVGRGQVATFLVRALEQAGASLPVSGTDRFTDDDGTTHESAINRLAAAGIIDDEGKTFEPGRAIYRTDMSRYVANSLRHVGYADSTSGTYWYDDALPPADSKSIDLLTRAGIVQGDGTGLFQTWRPLHRDQMATFLVRAYAALQEVP